MTSSDQVISIRIHYQMIGGHVYCKVYSSEFGPETAHGQNTQAPIVFRPTEFEAFRRLLEAGEMALGAIGLAFDPHPVPIVEFIEEGA